MKDENTPGSFSLSNCGKPDDLPGRWSQIPYAGETKPPAGIDELGGSWPLIYLWRDEGRFLTPERDPIDLAIKDPDKIPFEQELQVVKKTLRDLTPEQGAIAKYWGEGPPTKQFTPIIDRLIDTYALSPLQSARVLAVVQGALNDTFVVVWHLKYLWDIPRPNQLDQQLATLLCTPKFPTYPSGHATAAGCLEVVLSYFFAPEAVRLKELAEECAVSRLYGGVHFPSDNNQGLRLGRQIGRIIVDFLSNQWDVTHTRVDTPITENQYANLPPPPYKQVIPFSRPHDCTSLVIANNCTGWGWHSNIPKTKESI